MPKKRIHISTARIIALGFFALILCGTVLLMLPISTKDRLGASFLDALFTAVSATCVTGLVVQSTAVYWSAFGQAVILMLIQIGGMGVITVALLLSIFMRRRVNLQTRLVMQESISAPQMGNIMSKTVTIVRTIFLIELLGASLLAIRFVPQYGAKGIWFSVFHSISAFCNAGFDILGTPEAPFPSMVPFAFDPLVIVTLCELIVVGGIGFFVWQDFSDFKLRLSRMSLQTKLVLLTTALLLSFGFVFFFFYEFRQPQWADFTPGQRAWAALFQAVTPRTAGFNTVDYGSMSQTSLLVTIFLMLVGGSPGSTAGGLKTTTLALLVLNMRAAFLRRKHIQCFRRRISEEVIRNASALLTLYLTLFLVGGGAICCIENVSLIYALFESASAIGTAGLTCGITTSLSPVSHVILALLMYLGRVGGLTMLYAVTPDNTIVTLYPQETVNIG